MTAATPFFFCEARYLEIDRPKNGRLARIPFREYTRAPQPEGMGPCRQFYRASRWASGRSFLLSPSSLRLSPIRGGRTGILRRLCPDALINPRAGEEPRSFQHFTRLHRPSPVVVPRVFVPAYPNSRCSFASRQWLKRHGTKAGITTVGADGGDRTRTGMAREILSLLRLPVSPRPQAGQRVSGGGLSSQAGRSAGGLASPAQGRARSP